MSQLLKRPQRLQFTRNCDKTSGNHMTYYPRLGQTVVIESYRQLRTSRMARESRSRQESESWHLERLQWCVAEKSRFPQMSQIHNLFLVHESSSLGTHIRRFTQSTHTANQATSGGFSLCRVFVCCTTKARWILLCRWRSLTLHRDGRQRHHTVEGRGFRPQAVRQEWNAESTATPLDRAPERV